MGNLYWTSPSIWNGNWVRINLDCGGLLLEEAKEFLERRRKSTTTNMVACLDMERVNR